MCKVHYIIEHFENLQNVIKSEYICSIHGENTGKYAIKAVNKMEY